MVAAHYEEMEKDKSIKRIPIQLRPRETVVYVFYDIEEDRIRNQVANTCKNYGLERIQFSASVAVAIPMKKELKAER